MTATKRPNQGYTYVELLSAVVIGGLLMLGLSGLVANTLRSSDSVMARTNANREVSEAMRQMLHAVAYSRLLLLPLADNPTTTWPEHIREQTVPASTPIGDSTWASAVLAVTLPRDVDLDNDGVPDADNDGDGLIDEDPPSDNNHDGAAGLIGIDDNGDGTIDNSVSDYDDDEDGNIAVESFNGLDDDGDGSVDEDLADDLNHDGQSGIVGVDDDNDGWIDEADVNDDDEDGRVAEDWFDSLVFYLDNDTLNVRTPVPWDTNGDSSVTGADVVVSRLASHITRFRVERVAGTGLRHTLVDLTLEATDPVSGEVTSLQAQVRLGGAL